MFSAYVAGFLRSGEGYNGEILREDTDEEGIAAELAEPFEEWVRGRRAAQRQDSLEAQLRDVRMCANRLGCYDAADWIRDHA